MKKLLLIVHCSLLTLFPCFAQERNLEIAVGSSSLYDTYLSPQHYKGTEFRVMYQSEHWGVQGYLSSTKNQPAKNATELSALFQLDYSWHYHWQLLQHLDLAAGGKAELFLGGTYNTRNSNNPAQLRLGTDIAPSVRAMYDFSLWKKTFLLKYQGSLPIAGVQFSPNYGQSYYEIFSRNNYDHNACFTHPGNALSYTHQLTLCIPVGRHYLSVGYLGDYRQSRLNNLKYHNFSHMGLIGWSW